MLNRLKTALLLSLLTVLMVLMGSAIGGKSGIVGHLSIADNVHISAMSLVSRAISRPGQYTGVFPLDDNASWEKNAATLRQLSSLRDRIKALEKSLAQAAEPASKDKNTP